MKEIIKRLISRRGLIIFFVFATMILMIGAQKVSAEEQARMSYVIKVNRAYNTITVYEKDKKGEYTLPIKAMLCSVGQSGTQTKQGTFQTKAKYRWKELFGKVYGQYATRIVGGILFHSVYYYENGNPASLATKEFNKLGLAASHGCVRLTVGDAKWIYDNCDVGTTVIIYDDKKSPGPLGKPEGIKIPSKVFWDPTDPNKKNPYKEKQPSITGVKDRSLAWGDKINLRKGVKAKSTLGQDITSQLTIEGEVDYYIPGEYEITYTVTDALNKTNTKSITVTVEESTKKPELEGIADQYVKEGTKIDKKFLLTGVDAFCEGIKLNKNAIDVTIEMLNDEKYYIAYQVTMGETATTTEYATIYIDKEAPIFTGIVERYYETGEVPDPTDALTGVSVHDNYTDMEGYGIEVSIDETSEGSYLITYKAVDAAGNIAEEQVNFYN